MIEGGLVSDLAGVSLVLLVFLWSKNRTKKAKGNLKPSAQQQATHSTRRVHGGFFLPNVEGHHLVA